MKTIKVRLDQKVWKELVEESCHPNMKPEVTVSVMTAILKEIDRGNEVVNISFKGNPVYTGCYCCEGVCGCACHQGDGFGCN
jgi:hypothetical protein